MPNKTYLHKTWLSDSEFREWSKENVQSELCKCDTSLSNMDEKALHNHAAGKKT